MHGNATAARWPEHDSTARCLLAAAERAIGMAMGLNLHLLTWSREKDGPDLTAARRYRACLGRLRFALRATSMKHTLDSRPA
jgi:hypothetical protein